MSKKQYFLFIIDGCSRKVWVQFLATKNEDFGKFTEWKIMVENQVNKKVKCLRTDNGLEFCNLEFDEFCKKKWDWEAHDLLILTMAEWCSWKDEQNNHGESEMFAEWINVRREVLGISFIYSCIHNQHDTFIAIDFNIPEEIWPKKIPRYSYMRKFGSVV